jgi:SAM-dependent methyltransferase
MDDPVAITFHTFDRMAAAGIAPPRLEVAEHKRVEKFLLRTGRPLPNVIVLGRQLADLCRSVDAMGGAAIGVDGGDSVVAQARVSYPGGQFLQGDMRALPVDRNFFDGAWTSTVLAHIPRDDVAQAMASVHAALRPGGLLYVRLPLGDEEGFEHTDHGPVYRVRWDERLFVQAIGALDFDLIDREDMGTEVGLTLRREY